MSDRSPAATCDLLSPESLCAKRRYIARRERVWAAWTEPERLKKWFGSHGTSVEDVRIDLRVGGEYRKVIRMPTGERIEVFGEYREVKPPERLVYTWNVSGFADEARNVQDTLVSIDFIEHKDGSEICLTHERFPSEELRDRHSEGWSANLDQLAAFVEERSDGRLNTG